MSNEHASNEKTQEDTLAKWRGGRAKVWDYSPTLARLTIRIESQALALTGNLHIVCGGCQHIRGPFQWNNCSFKVTCQRDSDGEMVHLLQDARAGFEMRCWVVSLEENVPPVYSPSLKSAESQATGS